MRNALLQLDCYRGMRDADASPVLSGGIRVEGPVTVVPVRDNSSRGRGEAWNIVGGTVAGTPLAPNVGGFWLRKDDSVPPSPSHTGEQVTPVFGPGGVGVGSKDVLATVNGTPEDVAVSSEATAELIRAQVLPVDGQGDPSAGSHGRSSQGGSGGVTVDAGRLMTLQEDELQGILKMLAQIGRTMNGPKRGTRLKGVSSCGSSDITTARSLYRRACAFRDCGTSAIFGFRRHWADISLKLAEHIAIRFALERYERGDIQVDVVRQMLNESSAELDSLRKMLGIYEEKMAGTPPYQ